MDRPRPSLLIVDDEPSLLESLAGLLRRRFDVLTAPGGGPALELLRSGRPVHVILSDQRMPGMSGDAFLARAREVAPEAIRVLFTGYTEIGAVINAVNRGEIFRFLLKPWDPEELEAVLDQAVAQHELIADRRRLVEQLQSANDRLTSANRELTELNVLKDAFLEVASHEFNTPITLVHGMSELLRLLNPHRDEVERELLEKLSDGARRLARLLADSLKLMSAEDFRLSLRISSVDLAALLGEAAEQVAPFIHARSQRLERRFDPHLGRFELDADKIRDAVVNLLTNAIKFTPDGGLIELVLEPDGADGASIRVVDHGVGIEPRALSRLFEPFFTEFDPTYHSSGDFGFQKRGLGLGLSLVRKFVELHGGRVSAESAPGRGTTVRVALPRRPGASGGLPLSETGPLA
ncbi:hybrid sensor histidine kinase/response regulator [Tautonia plasticadhaerens]|uniref:histidine kinase n=1 Tax=Tautonia plasticadhaerens TaxID=2527974 RepID=A0A518H2Y5_9BACT|nr:hybrid sensor histidine kinase/response regulator [Tautonia plasticadhaerens]QDV35198.1 Non-motile and phage-resistance protein [Tautonia plasticadhaerens]